MTATQLGQSHGMAPGMPGGAPYRPRAIWFWLMVFGGFALALYSLRDILMPFIVGLAFAYALNPIVGVMTRAYIPRMLASLLVLGVFFSTLVGIFLLIVPVLQTELFALLPRIPYYATHAHGEVMHWLDHLSSKLSPEDWVHIKTAASASFDSALKWVTSFLGSLLTSGLALANILSLLIITPFVSFYFLQAWPQILATVEHWIPPGHRPEIVALFEDCDQALAGFARGQAAVCAILATFYSVGLWLIGLEFGFVVGLLSGLFAFVPYLGVGVGFLAAVLLATVQFETWQPIGLVVSLYGFGQFVESNFLAPKLVGNSVGLHPIFIIFALLAGASLGGFGGVIAAVPVAALLGVFARHALVWYLKSPYYQTILPKTTASTPPRPPKKSRLTLSTGSDYGA